MLKQILERFGVGVFVTLIALPVGAQEVATLVLRDGQRPSGELIDLNASGFTLRISGQDRQFSANDVAAVEFVGGAAPAAAQARIDAGQPLVVLRSGQIIEGRLSDIGGTHPLRVSVDTPGGTRDYTSNDVAQIYLFAPARAAAAPAQTTQQQQQQQDQGSTQRPQRGQQDPNTQRPQRGRQDPNTQQPQRGQPDQGTEPRGQRQRRQDQNNPDQQRGQQQRPPDQNMPREDRRLSEQRQQQLVEQQQQRLTQYRHDLDGQQRAVQQQTAQLQRQKRTSQYRVQQDYLDRLRQQQTALQTGREPDYERDPYFSTAPAYRYSRGGRDYETNQYGADLLRQSADTGYEQGFLAGDADRTDRWRGKYQDSYAYQDANYGYDGYYVDRDDYNYYFREGFRRGYEDGSNGRSQYGRNTDGSHNMLDAILSQVLGFVPLR